MACLGIGHDILCFNNSAQMDNFQITDLNNNPITQAYQGDTVRFRTLVSPNCLLGCTNFTIIWTMSGPEPVYIECYEDRIGCGDPGWWVHADYTIPLNLTPGLYQAVSIEDITGGVATLDFTVLQAVYPSGSIEFQEGQSAVIGTTIHADCVWQDALYNSTTGYYATMNIKNQFGVIEVEYNSTTNPSGTHTLSTLADHEGIWIAELQIWNGASWVIYNDAITIVAVAAPTALIDEPINNAIVINPVHFRGHGVSNAGGQITQYSWLDNNNPLSSQAEFDATLSIGVHQISFAVYCTIAGWSEYVHISITVTQQPQDCSNPFGNPGQTDPCGVGPGTNQPNTIHSYYCNNGTWVDTGENCPTCPDCIGDCTNPAGTQGQIDECGAGPGTNQPNTTHRYVCNEAQWDDLGVNCPTCPDCTVNGCEHATQAECQAAGCYWYAKYIWEEPSCHAAEQNMIMDYLPFIIVGAGGALIIASLFAKPKPTYSTSYPQPYPKYPPQQRKSRKSTKY